MIFFVCSWDQRRFTGNCPGRETTSLSLLTLANQKFFFGNNNSRMSLKKLYVNICSPANSTCEALTSDDESICDTRDEMKSDEDPLMVKPLPPRPRYPVAPLLAPVRNRSGRPHSASSLIFCPQPQSAVAASFCLARQKLQLQISSSTNEKLLKSEAGAGPSPTHSDINSTRVECKTEDCRIDECEEPVGKTGFKEGNRESGADSVTDPEETKVELEDPFTAIEDEEVKTVFVCNRPKCVFVGQSRKALNVHKRQEHSDSKDYVCDQCSYCTHAASDLRKHYRTHSGEQPYTCPQDGCTYRGKHSNNLNYHMRKMHPTGEPLKCEYNDCDYSTRFSCALRIHSIKKHSGEKTIACELCSYRCYIRGDLRKHMVSHSPATPYMCDFPGCSYACKLSSNLRKHRRSHTEERPYACEQCDFRSNFISSLKAHRRTHTDERPYCCDQCGYRCNSASNLKKHITQRHPGAAYTTKQATFSPPLPNSAVLMETETRSQPSHLFRNLYHVQQLNNVS